MAPIPVDNTLAADPISTQKPPAKFWSKANIAYTVVVSLLTLGVILAAVLFYLHRRTQKKKHEDSKSDKAGLLANGDKTSMFNRNRASSVNLYIDSEADARSKQASTDAIHLIPLHITPVEESRDSIGDNTESAGSGISAMSQNSIVTLSTRMLSPVSLSGEDGDLAMRPTGRARSTSTASQKARYYETTPTNGQMPPIPKIVHTPSQRY
ncbi:hypothetical protein EJ02DRAFT_456827 [Clathrospora elynae]|uniref:Uncharacterized protein n=1 Tax=Clathrospora elynae TaxID=706981 RepID=A0A6A5SLV2_9PLEO|nr:hypothetical protein EJ02DRAFT_456827 [Clathrospora elynae]